MDHGYGHEINVGYTKPISIMPIASRRLTEQKQKELKKNIDDQWPSVARYNENLHAYPGSAFVYGQKGWSNI